MKLWDRRVIEYRNQISASDDSLSLTISLYIYILVNFVAQTVKRLPTTWETWVQSLDRDDILEKEMATHSSTLAWKIPWMEDPGGLQSMGSKRVKHDWATSLSYIYVIDCNVSAQNSYVEVLIPSSIMWLFLKTEFFRRSLRLSEVIKV